MKKMEDINTFENRSKSNTVNIDTSTLDHLIINGIDYECKTRHIATLKGAPKYHKSKK